MQYFIGYYHIISDDEKMHVKHLYPHKTIKQFNDDLDFILEYFTPISLDEFFAFVKYGQPLPFRSLLLTFDDGFREISDIIAPILTKKGIPAIFFINSSFTDNHSLCYQHKISLLIEHLLRKHVTKSANKRIAALLLNNDIKNNDIISGILAIKYNKRYLVDVFALLLDVDFNDYLSKSKPYLTTEQITNLISKGFSIGAHSIDHPVYQDISLEEQIRQTKESASFVKKIFNLQYGVFAFPHSDAGVSKKYFSEITKTGLIDISFGTAGMIDDCIFNNFQRFSLEKPLLPAKNILALHYAKRLWRTSQNKNVMIRK